MMTPNQLALYLQRINFSADTLTNNLSTLSKLHRLHVCHVPFENFDVYTKQGILLDFDTLFSKVVLARRGGYCFELNELFACLLEQLGFQVSRHLGRVWIGTGWGNQAPVPPRTHQTLVVTLGQERYLVDVGFGNGIMLPLPLRSGAEQQQSGRRFRHQIDPIFGHLLEMSVEGQWHVQYSFTDELAYQNDYKVANFYSCHHANSRFTQHLICTLLTAEGRKTLFDRVLSIRSSDQEYKIQIDSQQQCLALLREHFAIELPAECVLPKFGLENEN
ncbi:arylamine N-acetyltransferase [Neisseriaceae bacterium TC5R-5]|nr:arylamine N-acetyltransferase [Neisseriaceae bacterium TC5R-5]